MKKFVAGEDEIGKRLDKAVADLYPEYSRSAIEKLIETGDIAVNGAQKQTRYKLKADDVVEVDFSYFQLPESEIQIPVLYEDDNIVVINKPIGVLAHPKGAFSKEGTVASWLKAHLSRHSSLEVESRKKIDPRVKSEDDKRDVEDDKTGGFWDSNRAGIVHRLDRGTSGVMILAKNELAQKHLQKQFAKRNVKKTYIAVISGQLPEEAGLIDVPIERNPKKPATFRAGVNGKSAQTEFKSLKTSDSQTINNKQPAHSLVELKPLTGRTHQLRVHLNYLKHPIVGDEIYGGEPAERLMLHALSLEITLPSSERKAFTAELPEVFNEYCK